MVHEQLLHIVIGCTECPVVVEPDHIRLPVHIGHVRQHGRIAGQSHGSGVALQGGHVGRLHQRVIPGVSPGSIFSQEYLRPVLGEGIIAVVVRQEPFRRHVIMLVNEIASVFPRASPAPFIFRSGGEWTRGVDQLNLRILFPNRAMDQHITFKKGVPHLFVSDPQIFQPERRGMAQRSPKTSPFGVRSTIGEFDQIQSVLNPGPHLIQRNHSLVMRIISAGKYGQGLCANVLTELKIFVIAQPQRLVITPVAPSGRTVFRFSQRIFPAIHGISVRRIQGSVMHQAAAGKTHEFRLHVAKELRDIPAQSVFPSQKGFLREKGNIIQRQPSCLRKSQKQPPGCGAPLCGQTQFIFFPFHIPDCKSG